MVKFKFLGLSGYFILSTLSTIVAQTQLPLWKGKIIKENGVTVVLNPKEPMIEGDLFALKVDWTIGQESPGAEPAFSQVAALAIDDLGRLFVVDRKECRIHIFDAEGRFVGSFGRQGQGPGEWSSPRAVAVLATGQVIVLDSGRGIFSYFDGEGRFLRELSYRESIGSSMRADARGRIVLLSAVLDPSKPYWTLKRFNGETSRSVELARLPSRISAGSVVNPLYPNPSFEVLGDGRILFNAGKTYEIVVIGADDRPSLRFGRDYDPVEVTPEDKQPFAGQTGGDGLTIKFERFHAPLRRFIADEQGRVVVETFERGSDGKKRIHDVFDAEGRYWGRVALAERPVLFRHDKLYFIETDEDGLELIKRYSLVWRK